MNLKELKNQVDDAITRAKENGDNVEDITVSVQIDSDDDSIYTSEVKLHYDNDCQASGCVLVGYIEAGC